MRGRLGSALISEVEEQLLGAQLAGSVDVIVASLQLSRPLYLYIQALDPHLRHGPRKLGRASGAGHSLPGARPLDPLVRMLDPSSGTHV